MKKLLKVIGEEIKPYLTKNKNGLGFFNPGSMENVDEFLQSSGLKDSRLICYTHNSKCKTSLGLCGKMCIHMEDYGGYKAKRPGFSGYKYLVGIFTRYETLEKDLSDLLENFLCTNGRGYIIVPGDSNKHTGISFSGFLSNIERNGGSHKHFHDGKHNYILIRTKG